MFAFASTFFNKNNHYQGFAAWCNGPLNGWIYVAKLLLGITLALWMAMFLQLSSTRSAVLTVLIVMQPQTGQVFTKSIARILGTIVGLAVSLTFVNLFHQQPVMFILATALWCMVCIAGAVRYRDLRSYFFLLSGYTVAMIGIPGAIAADVATSASLSRMLSVLVGIICGGLVSALVFPTASESAFRGLLSRRLVHLCGHSASLLHHKFTARQYEAIRLRLATMAVNTGSLRQAACAENPTLRQHNQQIIRLSYSFLELGTRLHSLARAYFALDRRQPEFQQVAVAFDQCAAPLLNLLDILQMEQRLTSRQTARYLKSLRLASVKTRQQIRDARQRLIATPAYQGLSLEAQQHVDDVFDTLVALLFRFAKQLYEYARDYAALEQPVSGEVHDAPARLTRLKTSVNKWYVISCGIRSFIVIAVIAALWYYSGWAGGTMFLQNAIIAVMLSATAPNPHKMAVALAQGAGLGYIVGFFITFNCLTQVDGFPLMMVTIAPVFIIGGWLTLHPRWVGVGAGVMINFCFVASPVNPAAYNPQQFVNNSIAGCLGMSLCAVLLALVFPPSGRWLSRVLIKDLRRLVGTAVMAPLPKLKSRIDSLSCDILTKTYSLTTGQVEVQRELMDWNSSVDSISHAVIELRHLLQHVDRETQTQWQVRFHTLGMALSRLYLMPDKAGHRAVLQLVNQGIETVRPRLEPETEKFDGAPQRQILSYLHYIHLALTDEQGPFAEFLAEPDPASVESGAGLATEH